MRLKFFIEVFDATNDNVRGNKNSIHGRAAAGGRWPGREAEDKSGKGILTLKE